jgi:hypothetical protein
MKEKLQELWERFKRLPTVYKVAIIGGIVLGAVLIYQLVKNRQSSSSGNQQSSGSPFGALPSLPGAGDLPSLGTPSPSALSSGTQDPGLMGLLSPSGPLFGPLFGTPSFPDLPVWNSGPADAPNPVRVAAPEPITRISTGIPAEPITHLASIAPAPEPITHASSVGPAPEPITRTLASAPAPEPISSRTATYTQPAETITRTYTAPTYVAAPKPGTTDAYALRATKLGF